MTARDAETNEGFTDHELRVQVFTLMVAGYEVGTVRVQVFVQPCVVYELQH